jgi:glycosyltransferase involved in cell wall biosynthesis
VVSLHRDLRTLRRTSPTWWDRFTTRVDREVGGVQVHVESVRTMLADQGVKVEVITPFDGSPWGPIGAALIQKLLRTRSPQLAETWRRGWHDWLLARSLTRRRHLLLTADPLVVYAQSPAAATVVRRVWPDRVPLVVAHHGANVALPIPPALDNHPNRDQVLWGVRPELRPGYEQVDGVVFVSEHLRDLVLHNAAINPDALQVVIPNFLPDNYGRSVKPDPSYLGRDLVTTGRLSPEKNLPFLLHLVAELHRLGAPVTLTIIGDGPERPALEALAAHLGISSSVRWAGTVTDPAPIVAAHSLYVHASTSETFGYAVVEAMMLARPVAVVPVGALPEIVADGVEGIWLDAGDLRSSAEAIHSLLEDPQRRSQLGHAGANKARSAYTACTAGAELRRFLDALARPPYAEAREPHTVPATLQWSSTPNGGGRLMVGMATYNRADYLRKAIDSVRQQSVGDFVMRIVDDASTDATPDLLAELDDDRICWARQPTNRGWLENCNAALSLVDTEYVTLLGDDDLMLPGALERAMDFLDAHPECSFVHAGVHIIGTHDEILVPDTNWTQDLTQDTVETGAEFIEKSMRLGNRVVSQTVMMRSKLLPAVPFDPRDGPVADFTLWLKLALAGSVGFIATPAVSYRVHPGSDSARWGSPTDSGYSKGPKIVLQQRRSKRRFIDEHADSLAGTTGLRVRSDLAAAKLMAAWAIGPTGRRIAKRQLVAMRRWTGRA